MQNITSLIYFTMHEAGGELIQTQQHIRLLRLFLNIDTPPTTTNYNIRKWWLQ